MPSIFLADIRGPIGPVGSWPNLTPLLSTTNLDTLKSGAYTPISTIAAEAMGLPTANIGTLIVYVWGNGTTQTWIPITSSGNQMWQRVKVGTSWQAWGRMDSSVTTLLSTADIDNLAIGDYQPISTAAASAMGLPSANVGPLMVRGRTTTGSQQQMFVPISSTPRIFIRSRVSTVWSAWGELSPGSGGGSGGGGDATGNSTQREMRLSTHRRRRGLVGTGGLPALCLIFDHGTNNFISKILPILRRLALPATLGLNSQMYSSTYQFRDSDNQTTFGMIEGAAVNDGIEIWNHGRLHNAGAPNEILGGRDELMAAMPKIPIEGWLHTGQYGDFNHGGTPEAYWNNAVGQTILNGHAIATGDLPGTIHPLDGNMVPGWDGTWTDTSLTIAKEIVIQAQSAGGGVMTRMHPMYLDTAGHTSVATLTTFLEWAAAERDAGRLMVLTGSGMALADAGTSHRDSLLPGSLVGSLQGWAGSGWTASSIGASSSGTNPLTLALPLTRVEQAVGSQREFRALVRATSTASVQISVTGTGINASRTVSVPAGQWIDVRKFFTIPLNATTLTFSITRISGGTLTVRDLNAYSA